MATTDATNVYAQPPTTPALQGARRARHLLQNFYIGPSRDPEALEIWAYSDRISYRPGDNVRLHISTTASTFDLEIGRDGALYEPRMALRAQPGQYHETPLDCSVAGCGWPVAHEFEVPADWSPGAYLVTLTGYRGDESVEEHHLFIVRRAPNTSPAQIVLMCATGTWVAYNDWGGSNHYEGITGPNANEFAPVVSTMRPWTRGFCKLPNGAPRTVSEHPPPPGEAVRYPYLEWAFANGYSKKFASAGWATYERQFARWAESAGFEVDYATLHDLHAEPDLLAPYGCAVFVGHDEYWSAEMRDAVDDWVERGGGAARFAGNFLWQIRLEDEGRRQTCYKYFATARDPVMGTTNQTRLTGAWEMPEVGRPGASTFGVNALQGIYASIGHCVARGSGGFVVFRPEHWSLTGTHIGYGDVLGADSRIFGYEVDGLDYEMRDNLPYPTGLDGAPDALVIVGVSPATNAEADHGQWGQTLSVRDGDARWKAEALNAEVSMENLASAQRGNGMMVSFRKGKGEVFTAATCEWVMGLTRHDVQVERVTRNVLERFVAVRKSGG